MTVEFRLFGRVEAHWPRPPGHCVCSTNWTTLDSLGYLAQQRGEPDKAREHRQQAHALRRELGDPYFEADTLDRLGQANDALGDAAGAKAAWREALRLYRAQHRLPDADRVQRQLDGVSTDQDRIASV